MNESDERYERGLRNLKELNAGAPDRLATATQGVAPDLARFTIEYGYGDVFNRPRVCKNSKCLTETLCRASRSTSALFGRCISTTSIESSLVGQVIATATEVSGKPEHAVFRRQKSPQALIASMMAMGPMILIKRLRLYAST